MTGLSRSGICGKPNLFDFSSPIELKVSHLLCSTSGTQREYYHNSPVNDVVVHPNQGELISCDQNGSVKIWDLGENSCTHELVPAEDVPIRSVSIAGDGGTLVAGNNKVSRFYLSFKPKRWKLK
jgi:WD40 repeat protein